MTVRLDLRLDAQLADALDHAATAAGQSIDAYVARLIRAAATGSA